MKPTHLRIRTAYAGSYFANTEQTSMRKLPLVAAEVEKRGFAELVAPEPVGADALRLIHDPEYVQSILTGKGPLAQCAFGFWSAGYRDGVLAINGGCLLAARMALEDGMAANIGQGFHHSRRECGGGYCTFNGLALVAALHPALKVLVIDCDEHGGDGTAEFTKELPNLTNFSICGHPLGAYEGPRSFVRKVPPRDEETALKYLQEALQICKQTRPDLVIYQAGMDPHREDPLSTSKMSARFLSQRDTLVMEKLALELKIPFFFVLAGGYQEPMEEKLIPRHVKTFEIAARVKAIASPLSY